MDEVELEECVDEALREIRRTWVDSPDPSYFSSHRNLAKCARDLKYMKSAMRDYAYSDKKTDPHVIDAVFKYIVEAYSIYLDALYKWISEANEKKSKKESVPSLPRVQNLLSEYDSDINEKLKRYCTKAKLAPEQRSEASSRTTSISDTVSRLSQESQEVIERILQEHGKEMAKMNEQLVDVSISVELQKQQIEEEQRRREEEQRRREEEQRLRQEEQRRRENLEEEYKRREELERQRHESECDRLTKSFYDEQRKERSRIKEKGEMLKEKYHLKKELHKYRNLATQALFPDAGQVNSLAPLTIESGAAVMLPSQHRQSVIIADGKEMLLEENKHTVEQPSTSIEERVMKNNRNGLHVQNIDTSVPTRQDLKSTHSLNSGNAILQKKYGENGDLCSDTPEYVPLAFRKKQESGYSTTRQLPEFSNTPWDHVRPRVINGSTKSTSDEDNVKHQEHMAYPWKNTGAKPEEGRLGMDELGCGQLSGRFYSRYASNLGGGLSGKEGQRRFSGKKSDYPMFRQQLLQEYNLLWSSDPYTLLQRIANSVSDSVYEHIKNAWIMRNPQDALDRIWEILEDLYGDPNGLLENAIQDVKWEKGSITNKVTQLQAYRTKLRNLQSVALSIGRENELSRPKLIIRILNCFNPTLHAQFLHEHKNFTAWKYETVLQFINEQLCYLQYVERQSYDLSVMISDDKARGLRSKIGLKTNKRINSVESCTSQECKRKDHCGQFETKMERLGPRPTKNSSISQAICVIHPWASHDTMECRQFLQKNVEERRKFVKANGLCFYCLRKHFAKYCRRKIPCAKCNKGHSELLHQEIKKNLDTTDVADNDAVDTSGQSVANRKTANITTFVNEEQHTNTFLGASVPIIALTAVNTTTDDCSVKEVNFYALLDTGADVSICSKKLAECFTGGNLMTLSIFVFWKNLRKLMSA